MGNFSWQSNFDSGETTFKFKSGFEKTAPRIFKFIEVMEIVEAMYNNNFSREELDFLIEVIKAARVDIKNKTNLKVVK